ncbi:hypothetical protein NQ315_012698 [Exocentrus adspersus]|uniref:BTB domain-containing protein n=1 Tax=Exocentrus adspersus TaxID=1586481 RepID=A0AAV8VS48_9CUCU|nr:hypothetical protein NQ315_012698 [Exocentrus adspersus]
MNKNGTSKSKYCIQSEKHPMHTSLGLCSLMEHQSLVDIAICCGNNTLHAHKVVLAANSPLFREELEKNFCIEQVIISGCDFSVIKSIIEFMYCGETTISEDYIKYLVAAAKLFQMKSLENLSLERTDYQFTGDIIVLPKPQFLSKKPKYSTYPFTANTGLAPNNILKPLNYSINSLYKPHKVKRKLRLEAEHQACIKEAHASRLAIANLKKEIASAPQANTFIIEETCTETTVENFIPHTEQSGFVEVDYNNIDSQVFVSNNNFNQQQPSKSSSLLQLALQNNGQALTADKIKHILGNEVPSNVEIMFKTSDGSFVTVTDEVLQNLSTKEGLQYQVVDENGQIGEVQELQVLGRESLDKINCQDPKTATQITNPEEFISTHFLDAEQIVFNSNPSGQDTLPSMSMDTSSKSFRIESNESSKDIEMLTLHEEELKPKFTESHPSEENVVKVGNYYDFVDGSIELKPTKCENSTDDKYVSPRNTRSLLKFSPDMFFADIPTGTGNMDVNVEEPDLKKLCVNRRKKVT